MTFEEEIKKYLKNQETVSNIFQNLNQLPKSKGIYIYTLSDKFQINITNKTTAKEVYNGKTLIYPKEKLIEKFNKGDKKTLYIGSTPNGSVFERTELRSRYAVTKDKNIRARGGRALWQIKDWGNLLFHYHICDNSEELETKLLKLYKNQYGVYPLANWKS